MAPISRVAKALSGLVVLLVTVYCLSGCAITYSIKNDVLPTSTGSAMVQQWPLSIGLFIPDSVKSKEFSKYAYRIPVGDTVVSTFHWTLSQMFAHVVDLDAPPSEGTLPGGLAGAVELTDVSCTHPSLSVIYEIALYSDRGEKIHDWVLSASGPIFDQQESSLSELIHAGGTKVTYRIREITAQFMVEFARVPQVRSWLENNGIDAAAAGPIFRNQAATGEVTPMVVLLPNIGTWLHTNAARAMDCIGHRLAQYVHPVRVIPAEGIRLEFFPWLEKAYAPKTIEELLKWLSEPAIQQKARAIGWHYLIDFGGGTHHSEMNGGILCGGGMGGGGCFGFGWWDRTSSFTATIFDIWSMDKLADASARREGRIYVPALLLPIPILTPTEGKACEELSRKLHGFITQGIMMEKQP